MKSLKGKISSLLVILIIAGLIYAIGAGNPIVIAVQNIISPVA